MHSLCEKPLFQLISEEGGLQGPVAPSFSNELLIRLLTEMKRIRILDEHMRVLQKQGRIGFYGACTGQEAVPVATAIALDPEDWVFPALRESAIMLVRGFPLSRYIAQLFGNANDVLKGRQMPSHMSSRAVHQVSWSSCIGTQLPHAVGAAWASRLRKDQTVVVGFLGDGATSQPDFHSAMNFAAVFCVPVVLICQNNQWAISVPVARQTASTTLAAKAHAYGMPGVRVDGNDAVAVYASVQAAVQRARQGLGPSFLECVTYRVGAHSSSDDPSLYRSQDEVNQWVRKDPILRLERYLLDAGVMDAAQMVRIEAASRQSVTTALAEAERVGAPAQSSLFEDVYAEPPWHLREQQAALCAVPNAAKGNL